MGRVRCVALRGRGREVRDDFGFGIAIGPGERLLRLVDPDRGRERRRARTPRDEALGMGGVRGGEHAGARLDPLLGQPVVDVVGREQAEADVAVLGVVPGEEVLAVGARVLDRAEAVGEIGPVLERLELRLGERVVVRRRGAASGSCVTPRSASSSATGFDVIDEPAVGVERELARRDVLPRGRSRAISFFASAALSPSATIQPTT